MASPEQWTRRLRTQIQTGELWPVEAGATFSDGIVALYERSNHSRKLAIAIGLAQLIGDGDAAVRTAAVLLFERVGGVLGAHRVGRLVDANLEALTGVDPHPDYHGVGPDLSAPLRRLLERLQAEEA